MQHMRSGSSHLRIYLWKLLKQCCCDHVNNTVLKSVSLDTFVITAMDKVGREENIVQMSRILMQVVATLKLIANVAV